MASFLSGMLGLDSGKATQKAAGQNLTALAGLWNRGTKYIDQGEAKSADYLGQAAGQFQPWQQTGTAANTMVGNALGLNGASGNAAATSAFQTSPGYDWTLKNALQGSERAASASGMLASGNTLTALQDRASQVANQEYGSWFDRLMGVSTQGQQAAGQTANALTNLGGLYQNTTDQRLGLNNTFTSGLIGANNQYAQGKEAQNAGLAGIGSSLGGLAGKFLGFL
ncbi:hypothetical protein [Ancylobacter polymorphus]|uniref:DNA injection protein n=1 Tax=Ancylobacter polymorphus TaxID=223390 RepID=A0ABU0BDB6_9HYPH|nr:hypothetical protein [Ancylobacter polymorphus]MDQ0303801.1 hypothetical protein [Ancylobacter polymorphus]